MNEQGMMNNKVRLLCNSTFSIQYSVFDIKKGDDESEIMKFSLR